VRSNWGNSNAYPVHRGGYDPVARTCYDTWVDTNDLAVRTDYGYWNADDNTMIWSTKQPDGAARSTAG
jgi:hypothetical protein